MAGEEGYQGAAGGEGIRDRLSKGGEEAIGKVAEELLENPMFNEALQRIMGLRDRAVQAQVSAMGAMNLPTAGDVERITRRVRSVSQRLERLEDSVERLTDTLDDDAARPAAPAQAADLDQRIQGLERQLDQLGGDLAAIRQAVTGADPVPRAQERLSVPRPGE